MTLWTVMTILLMSSRREVCAWWIVIVWSLYSSVIEKTPSTLTANMWSGCGLVLVLLEQFFYSVSVEAVFAVVAAAREVKHPEMSSASLLCIFFSWGWSQRSFSRLSKKYWVLPYSKEMVVFFPHPHLVEINSC